MTEPAPIDLRLYAYYPSDPRPFEKGIIDFIELLRALKMSRLFNHELIFRNTPVWEDIGRFIELQREFQKDMDPDGLFFSLHGVYIDPEWIYSTVEYEWMLPPYDHMIHRLQIEFDRLPINYAPNVQDYIKLIDIVTKWKRPQHLYFGPLDYLMNHQPIGKSRSGIGWIGWIPFDLKPEDLPVAELVRPMNMGTLIVSQSELWQSYEKSPYYSKEAVEQAQNVEIQLNAMGALPTADDLTGDDWGALIED